MKKIRKQKKLFGTLLLAVVIAISIFLSGCDWIILEHLKANSPELTHPNEYYGTREVGDFVVMFHSDDTCEILGTTEQGNTKRFLVVPEKIEDSPVAYFGFKPMLSSVATAPDIESEVLEKVFVKRGVRLWGFIGTDASDISHKANSSSKTIYLGTGGCQPTKERKTYVNGKLYGSYVDYEAEYLNIANVSYYYNYENAENDGYYWIDDCDYGGKIEFIPENPAREGYEFGGWYKEPECQNKWNFEEDILPQAQLNEDGEEKYQETILYAEWIEKE